MGRANRGGGFNTAGNQGGGNKLQGLVSTTNMRVELVPYVRMRSDGGDSRNWLFCMNQLGGVGRRWGQAAGPGNRGGIHAICKRHAEQSRLEYPRRPKQSIGYGSPYVFRANPFRVGQPPFVFTNGKLRLAVELWLTHRASAIKTYGDISNWDTSGVTDMRNMFTAGHAFNDDISKWNTSNVEYMQDMFAGAKSFNQDINAWNTSQVTDMSSMFADAGAFNGDISKWDTSSVTDMFSMFNGASAFNQDLSSWCVHLISAKPADFDTNSGLAPADLPVWGTCP